MLRSQLAGIGILSIKGIPRIRICKKLRYGNTGWILLCKKYSKTFYNLYYEKFADGSVKCIEEEIPFELPDGWVWSRLGSVFSTVTGSTPSTKNNALYGNDYPFYKPTDLDAGFEVYNSQDSVSEKGYLSGRSLPDKSVLVTCIGATIGKTGYIRNTGICNQQINAILPIEDISSEYTYFCICSEFEQQQIWENSSTTTLPILNRSKFDNLLFPVPPKEQQQLIVSRIKELLCFVEMIQKEKATLQEIIKKTKSKILDHAIHGQLVPQNPDDEPASVLLERIRAEKEELIKQGKIKRDKKESIIFKGADNSYYEKIGSEVHCIDEEIPFEIPETWEWCRGYTCFAGMESKKPIGDFFDYIDIDSIDNYNHKIKEPKHLPVSDAPSRAIKSGSVLFSLVRPYLENIALIEEKHSHCIASTGFYVCNSNGVFLPEFMFFLMISGYVVGGLNQYMKGDNSPSISKDNIENWLYPVPHLEEQRIICAKLQPVFSLLESVEKSLN